MELSIRNSHVPASELMAWAGEDTERQRAVELLTGYDDGWFLERGSVALTSHGTEPAGLSVGGLRAYASYVRGGDRLVLAAAAHVLEPDAPWKGPAAEGVQAALRELDPDSAVRVEAIIGPLPAEFGSADLASTPYIVGRDGSTPAWLPFRELHDWAGADRGRIAAVELLARHDGGWMADQSMPWIEPVHDYTVPVSQVEAGTELNVTGVRLDSGLLREAARFPGVDDVSKDVARAAADLVDGKLTVRIWAGSTPYPSVAALLDAAARYVDGEDNPWPGWSHERHWISGANMQTEGEVRVAHERVVAFDGVSWEDYGVVVDHPGAPRSGGDVNGAGVPGPLEPFPVVAPPDPPPAGYYSGQQPEWSWGREPSWADSSPSSQQPDWSAPQVAPETSGLLPPPSPAVSRPSPTAGI
jgi:hypothetical protein